MNKTINQLALLIFCCLISGCCFADSVLKVEPDPEKGFSFPFFLKIPDQTKTYYLIVETNNTGKDSDDFQEHFASAEKAIRGNSIGPWIAKKLNAPILVPVFPRFEREWETYTHALDRDTLLISSGKLQRIDHQLLAMIKEAKRLLKDKLVTVDNEIIMTGFSASGTFANRFSLLHPDALKLVIAGGLNGILMLPTESINGHKLDFPLGISDFKKVTGKPFNRQSWNSLPQFLFMGANDRNDAANYDDAYSDSEKSIIFSALGKVMQPNRWAKCQEAYDSHGANATFNTYSDIGHGTDLRIHNEILAFVKDNI